MRARASLRILCLGRHLCSSASLATHTTMDDDWDLLEEGAGDLPPRVVTERWTVTTKADGSQETRRQATRKRPAASSASDVRAVTVLRPVLKKQRLLNIRRPPQARPTRRGVGVCPVLQVGGLPPCPVVVTSDCTGLGAASVALRLLGLQPKNIFASERDARTRATLLANYSGAGSNVSLDVMMRADNELPSDAYNLDLYTAGPPCQPFSPKGLQLGLEDHRSHVLLRALEASSVHH